MRGSLLQMAKEVTLGLPDIADVPSMGRNLARQRQPKLKIKARDGTSCDGRAQHSPWVVIRMRYFKSGSGHTLESMFHRCCETKDPLNRAVDGAPYRHRGAHQRRRRRRCSYPALPALLLSQPSRETETCKFFDFLVHLQREYQWHFNILAI